MQRLIHAAIFASAMIFAAAPTVAANSSKLSASDLLAKVDAAVGDANVPIDDGAFLPPVQ